MLRYVTSCHVDVYFQLAVLSALLDFYHYISLQGISKSGDREKNKTLTWAQYVQCAYFSVQIILTDDISCEFCVNSSHKM